MSEKHSPEPWKRDGEEGYQAHYVRDADGDLLFGEDEYEEVVSAEDARRIVACVNACVGLTTEALEAGALAKALDALLAYHRGNRLRHDADAALYELSEPALIALGKVKP